MELRKFIATTIREFFNEELNHNTDGVIAYHRSSKRFDKLDISNVSLDSNRQRYGWGLYFSDTIPNDQYGDYLYKVKLFKNKKEYVLIDLKKPVEEYIVSKIVDAIKELNKNPNELVEFSYFGGLFYRALGRILGSDKKASLFLYENGIDGLKNSISKNINDYILFSDKNIMIEEVKYKNDVIMKRFNTK